METYIAEVLVSWTDGAAPTRAYYTIQHNALQLAEDRLSAYLSEYDYEIIDIYLVDAPVYCIVALTQNR